MMTQSEAMDADFLSSCVGSYKCKKRLTSVYFIMDSYHIQLAVHAEYDSVMKQKA